MKSKIKIGIDVDDCICNTLEMDYACAHFIMKKNLPQNIDKTHFDVTKTFSMANGDLFYTKEKEYIMKHNSMYPKVFVKEVIQKLRKRVLKFFSSHLEKINFGMEMQNNI